MPSCLLALRKHRRFHAVDTFDAANYGEFLINGRFDNGSEFGYAVEIVSIENGEATVRITAK